MKNNITQKIELANKTHQYRIDAELIRNYEATIQQSKEVLAVDQKVTSSDEATPSFLKSSFQIVNFRDLQVKKLIFDCGTLEY